MLGIEPWPSWKMSTLSTLPLHPMKKKSLFFFNQLIPGTLYNIADEVFAFISDNYKLSIIVIKLF